MTAFVLGQDGPASSLSRRGRPGPNRSEQDATAAAAAPACSTIVAAIAGSSIGSALVRMPTMNAPNPVNGSKTAGGGSAQGLGAVVGDRRRPVVGRGLRGRRACGAASCRPG